MLPALVRQRSSAKELEHHVDVFVDELVKVTKTKDNTIKIAVMNVLAEMTKALGPKMTGHFPKFVEFMSKAFSGDSTSSLQVPCLTALRHFVEGDGNSASFSGHTSAILEMV